METTPVMDNNKKTGIIILILIIFVWALISLFTGGNSERNSTINTVSIPPINANATPEQILEHSVIQTIANDNLSFGYISIQYGKEKNIMISVQTKSVWSKESLLRSSGKMSSGLFQNVYSSKVPLTDATIWYFGETVDRYGKKQNKVVLTYNMGKNTYNKIKWGNFNKSNLCEFLRTEKTDALLENACVLLAKIN